MPEYLPIIPYDEPVSERYERILNRNVNAPAYRDLRAEVQALDQESGAPLFVAALALVGSWSPMRVATVQPLAQRWANRLESRHTKVIGRNLRKVGRQAAMDASEEAVRRALRGKVLENVRLVTRLQPWMREGLERRIRGFIQTGDIIDFDKAALRKAITDSNVLTRSRLDLIADDQTNKFAAELNEIRMRAAGITNFRWVSQGDNRVRPLHRTYHGHTYSWDAPPADGLPGEPILCRCVAQGVLEAYTVNPLFA